MTSISSGAPASGDAPLSIEELTRQLNALADQTAAKNAQAQQSAAPSAPASGQPQPADGGNMSIEEIQRQLDALAAQTAAKNAQPPQAPANQPDPYLASNGGPLSVYNSPLIPDVVEGPLRQMGDAALGVTKSLGEAGWKDIFETKDLLFGEPDTKSSFRSGMEEMSAQDAQSSTVNGLVQSVGQFAFGMLGAGKLVRAASLVPKVGEAIGAAEGAIKSVKGGMAAAESVKAAAVGATVFDPHDDRLSNLIQQVPWLANPVNAWLAASPTDSAATGRLKNVLESLGMDAVAGTLMVGLKAYKGLRTGDHALILEAEKEAEAPPAAVEAGSGQNVGHQADAGSAAGTSTGPEVTQNVDGGGSNPSGAGGHTGILGADQGSSVDGLGAGGVASDIRTPGNGGTGNPPATGSASDVAGPAAEMHSGVDPAGSVGRDGNAGGAEHGSPVVSNGDGSNPGGLPVKAELVQNTADAQARDALSGQTVVEPNFKTIGVSELEMQAIERGLNADADALVTHDNNFMSAVYDGHPFANSAKIPYQKLNTPDAVGNLITDLTDMAKPELDAAKGGDVMSDHSIALQTAAMVRMFNGNPAETMALLEAAGQGAQRMTATMNTAYRIAARGFSDGYKTLLQARAGLPVDGMQPDQLRALALQQLDVATTALAHANSIRSNIGRSMRQLRPEFGITEKQLANVRTLDPATLEELLVQSEGDISQMARVVQKPNWVSSISDWAQFLLINNLLSGPKTQLVNAVTNAGMILLRPAERAIGSAFQWAAGAEGAGTAAVAAVKQYQFMASSLRAGFKGALTSLRIGDSVLSPHNVDALQRASPRPVEAFLDGIQFKPWDSTSNVIHNGLVAGLMKNGVKWGIGWPTRFLGAVDEMCKTIVYQSYVRSRAWEDGVNSGLAGKDLDDFIAQRVVGSVDDEGRAIDANAKREAQIATFSQDLDQWSIGRSVQSMVNQHPSLKLVLPFVKTPVNVLSMGIRYSPLLNLASKDLWVSLSGKAGREAQAQTAGQLALSTLFGATAASVVAEGRLTGGGPTNPQLRKQMLSEGWQPYSLVFDNKDGTKSYLPLSRYDPFGMPFGIIADLNDARNALGDAASGSSLIEEATNAVIIALVKNVTNRTYLQNLNQVLDALTDPDAHGGSFVAQQVANLVPGSSLLKQFNPDPYMREARSVVDKVMATIPGLSADLQPRLDAFGDPITVRRGLWSTDANDMVDRELLRLGMETSRGLTPPSATIDGVDLRDFTLKDGRNAYTAYQQLAGHPPGYDSLKTAIRKVMEKKAYQRADESSAVPGTKIAILQDLANSYRDNAKALLMRDPDLRAAFLKNRKAARDAQVANQTGGTQPNQQNTLMGTFQRMFGGAQQ